MDLSNFMPTIFNNSDPSTQATKKDPLDYSQETGLSAFNFSSIFDKKINDAIKNMNSPFHKIATHIDTINQKQSLSPENINTIVNDLFAVAGELIHFLQANGMDHGRIMDLHQTLNGLHLLAQEYGSRDAATSVASLHHMMPAGMDQITTAFMFQYVKLDTFRLDGYKKGNPTASAENIRLEIAYFQCTMMTTLTHNPRQTELSSHLAEMLMADDTIKESFDLIQDVDANYLADLEAQLINAGTGDDADSANDNSDNTTPS